MRSETKKALREVASERVKQDQQWGGPDHDDEHSPGDFVDFIEAQIAKGSRGAGPDARERFIKIAALAVAAIEMLDRTTAECSHD